jgi:hypothetical protein
MTSMSMAAAVIFKVYNDIAAAPYGCKLIKAAAATLNIFGTLKLLWLLQLVLRL